MEYIYHAYYVKTRQHADTCTRFEDAERNYSNTDLYYVTVDKANRNGAYEEFAKLNTQDDWDTLRVTLERGIWDPFKGTDIQMKKPQVVTRDELRKSKETKVVIIKDPINPPHYQTYLQNMQWLEAMQYIPDFRDPAKMKAALRLQIRKYLDRGDMKDNEFQELSKALWYLKFLLAYIKNENSPIKVANIETILNA